VDVVWTERGTFRIAVYQVAPIWVITRVAPVRSVEPCGHNGKYVVNFAKPAHSSGPINLVARGKVKAPQAPRNANHGRL